MRILQEVITVVVLKDGRGVTVKEVEFVFHNST